MAVAIPGLAIKIDGDSSGLQKTLDDIKTKLDDGLGASKMAAATAGVAVAMLAVEKFLDQLRFALNAGKMAFEEFFASAARIGDLKDLGQSVDLDVNELISIKRGAKLSGANVDAFMGAFDGLRDKIGETLSGGADPFAAIGLSAAMLSIQSPEKQLGAIADKLNEIADPALRQKLAEDIFGKSFRSFSLALAEGSAGMDAWRKQAEALGITLRGDVITKFDRIDDKVADVKMQLEAVKERLLVGITPVIEKVADATAAWLAQFNQSGALDLWAARIEMVAVTITNAIDVVNIGLRQALVVLKSIPGVKELAEGINKTMGDTPAFQFIAEIERGAQLRLEEWKKQEEKRLAEVARSESLQQSSLAKMRLGEILGKQFSALNNIGGAISDWWTGSPAKSLKADGSPVSSPQYAGALEMGTAAAYAAAYRVDQNAPEKEIAKNTAKSTSLLDKATGYLSDLVKKMPSIAPARLI